ncbi:hypothetical protein HZA97_02905 [Candidatus Woesearchaeota archaeon]|nr:hypothetical protein [Candidatus Woesearchaeota archaeon]
MTIWLILGIILVLYLFFAIFKKSIEKTAKIKVCAICLAVSLTWISLLTLYFFELFKDKIIIAILMGQSTVGIMYSFDKKFEKNKNILALKVLVILLGTLITYYILK